MTLLAILQHSLHDKT